MAPRCHHPLRTATGFQRWRTDIGGSKGRADRGGGERCLDEERAHGHEALRGRRPLNSIMAERCLWHCVIEHDPFELIESALAVHSDVKAIT